MHGKVSILNCTSSREVVFSPVCLVYLSAELGKNYLLKTTKLGGRMGSGQKKKPLNVGVDLDKGEDSGIVFS